MADDEQFSLCWNNFNTNLSAGFHESLCRGDLVDVTLAAEGQFVKAHRLVLSVCSPYFRKMFTSMPANQHAFVFLKDVSHSALKDLIQFMYCGEVNVKQDALPAFISTAEALQIKGLTDSDPAPPPAPSPTKPPTPAPQQMPTVQTSPRIKQQRISTSRSYKIETIEDSGDDNKHTQIVLQATSTPQHIQVQQTQPQQHQALIHQQTTTASQKRPAQRSVSTTQSKRLKNTVDPLEAVETNQITVQTVSEGKSSTSDHQEIIEFPIDIPTKSEPDYAEDATEVEEGTEQDATYVEEDSYGEMKYDESYFTENDDGNQSAATAATTSGIKQQNSFSDSYVDGADQSATEAQGTKDVELTYLESPWSTPCMVIEGYMYNCHSRKNGKEYWRCHNYSKKQQDQRCRTRCVILHDCLMFNLDKNCTNNDDFDKTKEIVNGIINSTGKVMDYTELATNALQSSEINDESKLDATELESLLKPNDLTVLIPLHFGSKVLVCKDSLLSIFVPNVSLYIYRLCELVFGMETLKSCAKLKPKERLDFLNEDYLESFITHVVQIFTKQGNTKINAQQVKKCILGKLQKIANQSK